MSFSDDEALPIGMYDYGAPDHPIHADAKIAEALTELNSLDRREAVLRARLASLTRITRTVVSSRSSNIISLKAYRAVLRDSAGRR